MDRYYVHMLETLEKYRQFVNNLKSSPKTLFLYAIQSDESLHPCATDVSLVFIKDYHSNHTVWVSFNHPDSLKVVDVATFVQDLNQAQGTKFVFDKKSFLQLVPGVEKLSDCNLIHHLETGGIIEEQMYHTNAHKFVYRSKRGCGDLNKVVPILKHLELFESMYKELMTVPDLFTCEMNSGFQRENGVVIETLAELEKNGIFVNKECFNKHFDANVNPNGLVYSRYNIYTSTGRPSNHFDGVNYAALNKENGCRGCFVSRHKNGGMILVDYSAFHPRIICQLVGFDFPIDGDIYAYLGEMYFGRKVTEYDMGEIKSITMRQLYGGVETKYESIKYLSHLKEFIQKSWAEFERFGYVLTPIFHRKITDKHILDPNPNKLFNYILQATETEIALSSLSAVNQYLRDKKTKAVLYTYDSILFDFSPDDGLSLLPDIIKIMMMHNRFPVKAYFGESYDDVVQIYPKV